MCLTTCPISRLCRQIADLEFELEQVVCDTNWGGREQAHTILKQRGDTRALAILDYYLKPAPLGLDQRELVAAGRGESE